MRPATIAKMGSAKFVAQAGGGVFVGVGRGVLVNVSVREGSRVALGGTLNVDVGAISLIAVDIAVAFGKTENCCFIQGMPNAITNMITNAPIIAAITLGDDLARRAVIFFTFLVGTATAMTGVSVFCASASVFSIAVIKAFISA